MRTRLFTIVSLGLLSAACQGPQTQTYRYAGAPATPPASTAAYATSEQACADYGFVSGTNNFDRCVSRERAARSEGRVGRDYEQNRLNADARNTCSSYGLEVGSSRFDRCVGREVDARSYREAAVMPAPTYRTDGSGYRIDSEGYRIDSNGYRMAPQSMNTAPFAAPRYAESRGYVEPNAGKAVSRDEFGFRYDTYGIRVDRNGNIISAQSTTP